MVIIKWVGPGWQNSYLLNSIAKWFKNLPNIEKENKTKKRDQLADITKKYQRLQKRQTNLKKKIKQNKTPIRTIVNQEGGVRTITRTAGNVETKEYE